MEKKNYIVKIQYDGTNYAGWRRQKHQSCTIQQIMEDTLRAMTGTKVNLHAASWTDAGVHAQGQVAALVIRQNLAPADFISQANSLLPADIHILSLEPAPRGFDPIGGNLGKHYRYTLSYGPESEKADQSWHLPEIPDITALHEAAGKLIGTHDFKGIKVSKDRRSNCIRSISRCEISQQENLIYLDFYGDNFIYLMIRSLTAALIKVALGQKPADYIDELLNASDNRHRPEPAPPHGLCLVNIFY
ncbi:MAG: tRNA pseudouridine(38-40) synthase TruA [Sedimentisphaerales bacterium]|nr:tRNA pseudouridine(38-40) synthase TruA [Sedimentisphaerales bacterium]